MDGLNNVPFHSVRSFCSPLQKSSRERQENKEKDNEAKDEAGKQTAKYSFSHSCKVEREGKERFREEPSCDARFLFFPLLLQLCS